MTEEKKNALDSDLPPDRENGAYQDMVQKGLRSMSDAANLLNNGIEIRKIPEGMFVNILLPVVRSWVADTQRNAEGNFGPQPDLGKWLTVAGGPNRELDVVDEKGEVIFRLPPPFMDVPPLAGKPVDRIVTIGNLIDHQETMLSNGESREVMKINNQLIDLLSPKPEDVKKTDYILAMAWIWDRYELPLEEVVGKELAPSIKKHLAKIKTGKSGKGTTKAAESDTDDGPAEYEY